MNLQMAYKLHGPIGLISPISPIGLIGSFSSMGPEKEARFAETPFVRIRTPFVRILIRSCGFVIRT